MIGSAGRARLLVSSLIALLGACGGTTTQGGSSTAGAGGGVQTIPPNASQTSVCPQLAPKAGVGCNGPATPCFYTDPFACVSTKAECVANAWSLSDSGVYIQGCPGGPAGAGGGPNAACPSVTPVSGEACAAPGIACDYPADCTTLTAICTQQRTWEIDIPAVLCADFGGMGGTGGQGPTPPETGGTAGVGGAPLGVNCPVATPTGGVSCFLPGNLVSYQCDYEYGCGTVHATCTGSWNITGNPGAGCSGI